MVDKHIPATFDEKCSNSTDKINNLCERIKNKFEQQGVNSFNTFGDIFKEFYNSFNKNPNNDIIV
jgi:hypothetical protein